jgi:hypothetical protein
MSEEGDPQFEQAKGNASRQLNETGQAVAHGVALSAFWGFLALFLWTASRGLGWLGGNGFTAEIDVSLTDDAVEPSGRGTLGLP